VKLFLAGLLFATAASAQQYPSKPIRLLLTFSSGGQADFARGAMYSEGGQGFVVLRSSAKGGTVSRIVAQLAAGDVVTTIKNTVDKVVTEWGAAELRGRSIRERATALIAIAHPDHREHLRHRAHHLGYL